MRIRYDLDRFQERLGGPPKPRRALVVALGARYGCQRVQRHVYDIPGPSRFSGQ